MRNVKRWKNTSKIHHLFSFKNKLKCLRFLSSAIICKRGFAFWLYSADHKDGMQPDQVLPRCSRFFMENMNSLHAAHTPKTSLEILKDGTISGISTHNSKEIYESFFNFLCVSSILRASTTRVDQKKKEEKKTCKSFFIVATFSAATFASSSDRNC